MKIIDRFCYKHPRFGIPNLMTYIVIGSVAVWVLCLMSSMTAAMGYARPVNAMANLLVLNPERVLKGEFWRLATFLLVPQSASVLELLFFYFYYLVGNVLEREWGTARFTLFLISGAVITTVFCFAVYFITGTAINAGAYYIYLSMFFAYATVYPDRQILFMFVLPIKVKWIALADAVYFAVCIFSALVSPMSPAAALLPVVAIINYLIFFWGDIAHLIKGTETRRSAASVNFNREKARMKYENREKRYNHKCAVCGRTDTEYPRLEFRYCSRCAGYHCFCADHINNHVHFTE